MYSVIYQISSQPISREEYIGIDHIEVGNMTSFDCAYESSEEERREDIRCLMEHILPKEVFPLSEDGETIVYQDSFVEWRKSYLDTIHTRITGINEENTMEWAGPAYQLQKAVFNPFYTDAPLVTGFSNGCRLAERSRKLMTIIDNLKIGDKLYAGAVLGYHF